jgi:hypothetical protein
MNTTSGAAHPDIAPHTDAPLVARPDLASYGHLGPAWDLGRPNLSTPPDITPGPRATQAATSFVANTRKEAGRYAPGPTWRPTNARRSQQRRRPPTDLGARPTHHVRAQTTRTRRASGPTPDSPQDQRAGAARRGRRQGTLTSTGASQRSVCRPDRRLRQAVAHLGTSGVTECVAPTSAGRFRPRS